MGSTAIIASRIGLLILVVSVGWALRRKGIVTATTTRQLSRLVVDLAFPSLVVVSLVRSVTWSTLGVDAFGIIAGGAVVAISLLLGWLSARLASGSRRTFAFVVGTPNWVFLPLLIAEALFGQAGTRVIFMMNVGALVVLWTAGLAVLSPTRMGQTKATWRGTLRSICLNPGLIATVIGLALALGLPQLRHILDAPLGGLGPLELVAKTLLEGLNMFGAVTIPLALLVTGAQLGATPVRGLGPTRAVLGVAVLRLAVAPAVVALALWGCRALGADIPLTSQALVVVVAAMPVAVSASLFAERFDGDTTLAAKTVLWTTLASIITVPLAMDLLGLL